MVTYSYCKEEDATHVMIIDKSNCELGNVTYGGIYSYQFDESPNEKSYFIKNDIGQLLYDFELFLECKYLKLKS